MQRAAASPSISSAPSRVSLNHVLELLVVAQREILDTQRDLIISKASHLSLGDTPSDHVAIDQSNSAMVSTNRRAEDSNEMKLIHLIQRYQENSVDLLNKAAEGLVEVIMSWRPTLDAQSAALFGPQHHDSFNASPLAVMSQVLQPNSVFVATVAEVEELEFKVKEEKRAKWTTWCLLQWCLQVLRRREAKHGKEREAFHTSVDEMRRISDAIREKSVELLHQHRELQTTAAAQLLCSTERSSVASFWAKWRQYSAAKASEKARALERGNDRLTATKEVKAIELFSMWHRRKLTRRIEALESELQAAQADASATCASLKHQHESRLSLLRREVHSLEEKLQWEQHERSTFELDLKRAEATVTELTAQLQAACAMSDVAMRTQHDTILKHEGFFQEKLIRLETMEAERKLLLDQQKRELSILLERHATVPTSTYLDSVVGAVDYQLTMRLSAFAEAAKSVLWEASQLNRNTKSSPNSYPHHSMTHLRTNSRDIMATAMVLESDSGRGSDEEDDDGELSSRCSMIDKTELRLKISKLTHELECLKGNALLMRSEEYDINPVVGSSSVFSPLNDANGNECPISIDSSHRFPYISPLYSPSSSQQPESAQRRRSAPAVVPSPRRDASALQLYEHEVSPRLQRHKSNLLVTTSASPPQQVSSHGEHSNTVSTARYEQLRAKACRLLRHQNKLLVAARCFRRWTTVSQTSLLRSRLRSVDQERKSLLQTTVETRDRALVELDEQFEDVHSRLQQAISENRTMMLTAASPSPIRHALLELDLTGTYGETAHLISETSPLAQQQQHNGSTARRLAAAFRSPISLKQQSSLTDTNVATAVMMHSGSGTDSSTTSPFIGIPLTRQTNDAQVQTMPVVPDGEGPSMYVSVEMLQAENEELHAALTASHLRYDALMSKLGGAQPTSAPITSSLQVGRTPSDHVSNAVANELHVLPLGTNNNDDLDDTLSASSLTPTSMPSHHEERNEALEAERRAYQVIVTELDETNGRLETLYDEQRIRLHVFCWFASKAADFTSRERDDAQRASTLAQTDAELLLSRCGMIRSVLLMFRSKAAEGLCAVNQRLLAQRYLHTWRMSAVANRVNSVAREVAHSMLDHYKSTVEEPLLASLRHTIEHQEKLLATAKGDRDHLTVKYQQELEALRSHHEAEIKEARDQRQQDREEMHLYLEEHLHLKSHEQQQMQDILAEELREEKEKVEYLGNRLVEYCAAATFVRWRWFVQRKKILRQSQHVIGTMLPAVINTFGTSAVGTASQAVSDKWELYAGCVEKALRNTREALSFALGEKSQLATRLAETERRIDVLEESIDVTWRPIIPELEDARREKESLMQLFNDYQVRVIEEAAAVEANHREQLAAVEREHELYCRELKESEEMRTTELLLAQRCEHADQLKQRATEWEASTSEQVSAALSHSSALVALWSSGCLKAQIDLFVEGCAASYHALKLQKQAAHVNWDGEILIDGFRRLAIAEVLLHEAALQGEQVLLRERLGRYAVMQNERNHQRHAHELLLSCAAARSAIESEHSACFVDVMRLHCVAALQTIESALSRQLLSASQEAIESRAFIQFLERTIEAQTHEKNGLVASLEKCEAEIAATKQQTQRDNAELEEFYLGKLTVQQRTHDEDIATMRLNYESVRAKARQEVVELNKRVSTLEQEALQQHLSADDRHLRLTATHDAEMEELRARLSSKLEETVRGMQEAHAKRLNEVERRLTDSHQRDILEKIKEAEQRVTVNLSLQWSQIVALLCDEQQHRSQCLYFAFDAMSDLLQWHMDAVTASFASECADRENNLTAAYEQEQQKRATETEELVKRLRTMHASEVEKLLTTSHQHINEAEDALRRSHAAECDALTVALRDKDTEIQQLRSQRGSEVLEERRAFEVARQELQTTLARTVIECEQETRGGIAFLQTYVFALLSEWHATFVQAALRIREEVAIELEGRLDEQTASRQDVLKRQLEILRSNLDEKQHQHDETVSLLQGLHKKELSRTREEYETLYRSAWEEECREKQRGEVEGKLLRPLREKVTLLETELELCRANCAQMAMDGKKQREAAIASLAESESSQRRTVMWMEQVHMDQLNWFAHESSANTARLTSLHRVFDEEQRKLKERHERDQRFALEAQEHKFHSVLEEERAAHRENLERLTLDLMETSKEALSSLRSSQAGQCTTAAASSQTAEARFAVEQRASALLVFYANKLALLKAFQQWREWTLLRAFREDYQKLKATNDESERERSELKLVLAKLLEEKRRTTEAGIESRSSKSIPSNTRPEGNVFPPSQPHSPQSVGDEQVMVSPMSQHDDASPSARPSVLEQQPTPRTSVVNASSTSPSGRVVSKKTVHFATVDQMYKFSHAVNVQTVRSQSVVDHTDQLVASVDDLIRRGNQLRAFTPTARVASSSPPAGRADDELTTTRRRTQMTFTQQRGQQHQYTTPEEKRELF